MRRTIALIALLAAVLGADGCAYYNTFYLARKNYNEAVRREKLTTQDKVSPEVAALYDKSIEKSAKVIANHSKSRWVDDAIYLIGMSLLGKRDYDAALKKFEELKANYPKSNLVPDAVFMTGICHQKKRNFEQANAVFEAVIREYPKFSRRDEVLLIVARGAVEEGKRQEAIAGYRELVRRYGGSDFRDEAYVEMGNQYMELDEPDSARMAYEEAVESADDDDARARAMIRLSGALAKVGRADDALRVGRRALTVTKTQEILAEVRLANGAALRQAGRYDEAIEAYQEVVDLHPRTLSAAQAQFEIGYVHEVYKQDAAAAREAYDRVKQHGGTSGYAEQAALRSKNLERLQQFSQELESSGDQAAAAAFKLAELKFFQLEKPEEALELYAKVETEHAASPYAAKAAFARAWILQKSLDDSAGALTEFQRIVDLYPRSQAAAKSREILGLPPVFFEPDPVAVADSIAAADSARADSLAALPDSAFADSLAAAGGRRGRGAPADSARAAASADSAAADSLAGEPGRIEHPELRGEAPSTHPSELTPAEVESIGRARRDSLGLPIQVRER